MDNYRGAGGAGVILRAMSAAIPSRESNAPAAMGGNSDCNMDLIAPSPPPGGAISYHPRAKRIDADIHRNTYFILGMGASRFLCEAEITPHIDMGEYVVSPDA